MDIWKKLGEHLDNSLYICLLDDSEVLKTENFSSSVILLCFGNKKSNDTLLNNLFNLLLETAPLAIHFSGKNSEKYFTFIFDNETLAKSEKHTMTYLSKTSKISEWISDFFLASWPSEDRFSEWKDCRIIVLDKDNDSLYLNVCKEVERFLNNKIHKNK